MTAAAGGALYVALHGVTIAAVALGVAWLLACGFSVTGGYHRLFAHAAYRAHPVVRAFFLLFGAAAFENSALKWARDHRRHHRYVDGENDPYNIRKGFWWAHIGWVLMKEPPDRADRPVGDLERDPLVRWQHRYYVPLAIVAGFALPTFAGYLLGDAWGGLVLAGFVRLVLLYHCTFSVNSVAHTLGAQPYSDASSARDSSLTALITLGEGYHNFHHTFPYDYRNGIRPYHFDPTKWLIRGLECVGLTHALVRTPDDAVLRARLRTQERQAKRALADVPKASERLQAMRHRLEAMLDRWAALKEQLAHARTRSGDRSREAITALAGKIREARRQFQNAYEAWFHLVRRPRRLLSEI